MPEQETIGGIQSVTCPRCGDPVLDQQNTEQHQDGTRTHTLQHCFDVVKGQLDATKSKDVEPVALESEADEASTKKK